MATKAESLKVIRDLLLDLQETMTIFRIRHAEDSALVADQYAKAIRTLDDVESWLNQKYAPNFVMTRLREAGWYQVRTAYLLARDRWKAMHRNDHNQAGE